jgi:hypothetical protein
MTTIVPGHRRPRQGMMVTGLARISHTHVVVIAFWGGDPTSRALPARLAALPKGATPAVVRQNATPKGRGKIGNTLRYRSCSMRRIELHPLPCVLPIFPP